jgi:aldehyde dehydrogenase (NAD+)
MPGTSANTDHAAPRVRSLIGGRAPEQDGQAYTSRNPTDLDEVVAVAELGGPETLHEACTTATAAKAGWAATPAPVRSKAIKAIGRIVERNKDDLARLITREIGKPYGESLGEVQEVIDTCDFFVSEGRRLYGHTVPSEMPDKQLFTFRKPVGVSLIITAGNFPVAVPSWYLVPALLCGNTVVWKPAEYTPAIADAFARIFLHAGLPEGVFNLALVDGAATATGLEWVLRDNLVDKVGFTGSSAVGAMIGESCGRHLQAPCLELGGKNPLVVMDDADLDLAVEGSLFSGFGTSGQRCTSLGSAIVHHAVYDRFLERFTAAVEGAVIGDPMADVLYGPMLNERFGDAFLKSLDLIQAHHQVSGSSNVGRISSTAPRQGFVGDPDRGVFMHPTIVSGVRGEDDIANQETFGPVVCVAKFDDFDQAIDLANRHGYGLSSAIYTNDPASAFHFRERVSAGMVSVNNSTSGAEAHLPFGGNGKSGNGSRQSGVWVLDQFTRWQSLNWDFAGHLQKAQMDTAEVGADTDFTL